MTFFLISLLLCLIACAFVLLPLWMQRRGSDRRSAIAGLIATRLAELEREHRDGLIDDASYAQLRLEQERRLLAEADEAGLTTPARSGRPWLLPLCAVLIPLAALLLYHRLGGLADWEIQQQLEKNEAMAAAGQNNEAALRELAATLDRRLEQVADEEGRRRYLAARLAVELGDFAVAAGHYRQLVEQFPQDAAMNAQYAQTLYLSSQRQLTPEVLEYANKALQIDPNQTTALGLLGIAAFERSDYSVALDHWRRLQGLLAPGSPSAQIIGEGIRRAEAALGETGEGTEPEPASTGPTLKVEVTLAPDLEAPADGTLFVFARAANGPPLPLAAVRLNQPKLPLQVELTDAQAMAPGNTLSTALAAGTQVQVVARISKSGQALPEAGDLEGASGPLRLDGAASSLTLTIDRRL